jgi:hypothetical protein
VKSLEKSGGGGGGVENPSYFTTAASSCILDEGCTTSYTNLLNCVKLTVCLLAPVVCIPYTSSDIFQGASKQALTSTNEIISNSLSGIIRELGTYLDDEKSEAIKIEATKKFIILFCVNGL